MANRAAWVSSPGGGAGLTWATAINGTDLASLANVQSVMSSVADITNGSFLDLYADVSVWLTPAAAGTQAAGSYIGIYIVPVINTSSGTTYGDGSFASGTKVTMAPPYAPVGTIPLQTTSSLAVFSGMVQGILLPPGSFRFLLYLAAAALSATAAQQVVMYRTYGLNLNA